MNLFIEQRSHTITSKTKNDINHCLSSSLSSPVVVKLKQQIDFNSNSLLMANEDKNNSHTIPTNQRIKRPIPNSSTRRASSPAFNGKQQQSTKRSVNIDNNNNDLTSNIDDISSTKRFKQDDLNQSSNKVDACVGTVSVGLATEPDQLGPCEPGTSVVLEGIVWNETDNGVLVVNVTWRGKTYVGTLLDSTKQDWACPRLTCESPTSDYDVRNSNKTNRSKRSSVGGNNRTSTYQQISSNTYNSGSDDRKLRNNIKSRQSKRTNLNTIDETINNSSPLTSPFPTNTKFFSSSNIESTFLSCPESQCHKRFVSSIALNYHISDAHKKTDSNSSTSVQQASTRDEEDVAHILANVADYVRRPSPRSSPEHQRSTTLTWPCPNVSSNLVRSSSLNNNEQTSIPSTTRSILNKNKNNIEQDDLQSTVKRADHFLLNIQDESSWTNLNENKKTVKIPTPPPSSSSSSSSFIPIDLPGNIQSIPTSSSPAYSDISDEDPTVTKNSNQSISASTVNLLTTTNENDQSFIPNPSWTTQMLLQQYNSYMPQQTFINKELTSNRLNSKTHTNGTSDSTIKNILDSRRLSTTKRSSPSPSSSSTTTTIQSNDSNILLNDYQKPLYHHYTNGLINSLSSPNENLLNPSTTNVLDYSLNNMSSSSIDPSR